MQDEFTQRIKQIEEELLALKTNSKYTSAKPMEYASVAVTESGVYRITYRNIDENILAMVTNAYPTQIFTEVRARNIQGSIQDVEIFIDPDYIGGAVQLTILSTAEVVGFQKV